MANIKAVALVVLSIAFLTSVAFFGRLPLLRNTRVAWIHGFLWTTVPNSLLTLDGKMTSGRLSTCLRRFGHHVMLDRHPTVLLFFLSLLAGGEYLYLPTVWPQLRPSQKVIGTISMICPYLFLYLAASADPGYITAENHQEMMSQYPFDYVLFHPGSHCRTCRTVKPARSKHCSICKHCISRADHHCIFINGCVGQRNLHWFILLLLSTAFLTSYGALLGLTLLGADMKARHPGFSIWPPSAMGYDWQVYFAVWAAGLRKDAGAGSVTILATLTSPLIWGLFWYNIYMVHAGTTTNESLKWSDWQAEIDDGHAFRRRMSSTRRKDPRFEPIPTRWPNETEQILIRTESGNPPREDSTNIPGIGKWQRPTSIRGIENIYDLGFWGNLREVFFPRHQFSSSGIPVSERVDTKGLGRTNP